MDLTLQSLMLCQTRQATDIYSPAGVTIHLGETNLVLAAPTIQTKW